MRIRSSIKPQAAPKALAQTKQEPVQPDPPNESFIQRNAENIVVLSTVASMIGSGVAVGSNFAMGFDGFSGAGLGLAAGVVTGAVAGLAAGEVFLKAYPLDPGNEKEKYTALTRGAAGLVGGGVGLVAGGLAGVLGAQPWIVAPVTVLSGALAAGVTSSLVSGK